MKLEVKKIKKFYEQIWYNKMRFPITLLPNFIHSRWRKHKIGNQVANKSTAAPQ